MRLYFGGGGGTNEQTNQPTNQAKSKQTNKQTPKFLGTKKLSDLKKKKNIRKIQLLNLKNKLYLMYLN